MRKALFLPLTIMSVLGLIGCDTRELPTEKVITLYNSNMEKTSRMNTLDTLYVKVGGLKPFTSYKVEALDPNRQLISKMQVSTDAQGIIGPAPLWYDVGLKGDANGIGRPDLDSGLALKSFYVHVIGDGSTDYSEPFFIVNSGNLANGEQPRPVIWAASAAGGGVENAFEETGSPTVTVDTNNDTIPDLSVPAKTQVFIEGRDLLDSVQTVDVYVFPSRSPELWQGGDGLTSAYIVRKLEVATSDAVPTDGKRELSTLIWDLNDPATPLINPTEANAAYDVVVDVNRNGIFDPGTDINGDGVTDRYLDGIDGQGVPGFIVVNTEANNFMAKIIDQSGNLSTSVIEGALAPAEQSLTLAMKNLPDGIQPDEVRVKLLDEDGIIIATTSPTTVALPAGEFLPAATVKFLDSTNWTVNPASTSFTVIAEIYHQNLWREDFRGTIRVIHYFAEVTPTDGITPTFTFDESGKSNGKTKVYARVDSNIPSLGSNSQLFIYAHHDFWPAGFGLAAGNAKVNSPYQAGTDQLLWDLDNTPQLINPTTENNVYDMILDLNGDGIYNSGEPVASFAVNDDPNTNNPKDRFADVSYINLASGGVFNITNWDHWGINTVKDLDYRDRFTSNGQDTWYYPAYGIRVIWNPYIRYTGWAGQYIPEAKNEIKDLHYGRYVDVYVVDATTADLSEGALLGSGGNVDISGGVDTLPVQESCYNGAGQQVVWYPTFKPGRYFVVVDVNRDGKITRNVDVIDAVDGQGRSILDDPTVVGFTVD